jgi:Protein of unknown function (DUF952)
VTLATLSRSAPEGRPDEPHLSHRHRSRLGARLSRRALRRLDPRPDLAEEGFIHASTAAQVTQVANAFYRGEPDLLPLVIDTGLVGPEIRWAPR